MCVDMAPSKNNQSHKDSTADRFACLFSGTHSMVITKYGLRKGPSWMVHGRRLDATCSYKRINPLNKPLHEAFIHTTITKSSQAKANAVAISKISNAGMGMAANAT